MCGIAGYVSFGISPGPEWIRERLRLMCNAMVHRGPNDEGYYISPDSRVGLAHRRLSIIDTTSAGRQPMGSPDNRFHLTFNGELFDYRRIRTQLRNYPFASESDTEVLLALLGSEPAPEKLLPSLNGMFAFAFYDAARGRLLLGRDHTGVKPLYYSRTSDALWFASEPGALFAGTEIKARLDRLQYAVNVAVRMEAEGRQTWFSGVEQIEPAHYAVVDVGFSNIVQHEYWCPRFDDAETSPEEVREAFVTAVASRQYSDVPRAVLLSGGVDSSAVASCCVDLGLDVLGCIITYEHDHPEVRSDVEHAVEFAREKQIPHELITVSTAEVADLVGEATSRVQRPSLHGAELGMLCAYRAIKSLGRTVVYSGHGADEAWGYQDGLYFELLSPGFTPDMHSRHYLTRHLFQQAAPGWKTFLERIIFPAMGVTSAEVEEVIWEQTLSAYRSCDTIDPVKRARFHLLRRFLVYVNQMVDSLSMTYSIEDRPAFQDYRLLDIAFGMPEFVKNRAGPTNFKPFLKQALAPLLPNKILYRPKVGFQPPRNEQIRIRCRELMPRTLILGGDLSDAELDALPFTQLYTLFTTHKWIEIFGLDL